MNDQNTFIQGLVLCGRFYAECVKPIISPVVGNIPYAAAIIGDGSEVLGFDTQQSADHDWGPRIQLFFNSNDLETIGDLLKERLESELPKSFLGFSTQWCTPSICIVRSASEVLSHTLRQVVVLTTPLVVFEHELGLDPTSPLSLIDWLTFPQQSLLGLTSGEVFFDSAQALTALRQTFTYYPTDVWLYLLASQWRRIGQEEAFVGRCGDVGDDLGSRIVASRLVKDIMKLCFLMERQYCPYIKWFGTAFSKLACAKSLSDVLVNVLSAKDWKGREKHLSVAYGIIAAMHNGLAITDKFDVKVSNFHDRPYLVIHADQFAEAIKTKIVDPFLRMKIPNIGAIDQFIDNTDLLTDTNLSRKITSLFERD